ncbi:hypothetical protein GCK32_021508 [Trichostrongylus colubriformis]|uniref:Uncharacterized protein n=1 Tax=Trichostrongylus colubriformis TaxID=6319 RepID=A0AAN8FK16_TRICO
MTQHTTIDKDITTTDRIEATANATLATTDHHLKIDILLEVLLEIGIGAEAIQTAVALVHHLEKVVTVRKKVGRILLLDVTPSPQLRLIVAKSHLNNPKPITIPRAELLAILISTRLAHYIVQQLDMSVSAIHLFSDPQIALHWIHSSHQFKTFVRNGVDSIKKITMSFRSQGISSKFYYVASEINPAEYATRGLSTKKRRIIRGGQERHSYFNPSGCGLTPI